MLIISHTINHYYSNMIRIYLLLGLEDPVSFMYIKIEGGLNVYIKGLKFYLFGVSKLYFIILNPIKG